MSVPSFSRFAPHSVRPGRRLARIATAGAGALVAMLLATSVAAHSGKTGSDPADGAVLKSAPSAITIHFDSPVRVTSVTVLDDAGKTRRLVRPSEAVSRFQAPAPDLAAGSYTVRWRGLSTDGHPTGGEFSFTVR